VGTCTTTGGDAGTTVGLPCNPDGLNPDGTSCRTRLRPPREGEVTAGGERELWTGIVAGGDFVYRHFTHSWEDVETNAIWNQGGTDLMPSGRYKTGRAQFVFDLETPDVSQHTNTSFTAFLRKREGLLKATLSYTWSRSMGTTLNNYAGSFLDNPGQTPYYYGPLADDIRHDLRAFLTYAVRTWASVGLSYDFITGSPYNHYFYDPLFQEFRDFRARRGYDWAGTANPDDDIALRLPDLSILNLQVRISLRPLIKQELEVFADVFNVLALRTTTSVIESDGPFWGQQLSRLQPLSARLGLHYRFF
jgi:hypothetical protein